MRKFATKIASQQNSVNQYWGVKFIFIIFGVLVGILGVLVGVFGVLVGVLGVLVGLLGVSVGIFIIGMVVFWFAYSFDWNGTLGVLVAVF